MIIINECRGKSGNKRPEDYMKYIINNKSYVALITVTTWLLSATSSPDKPKLTVILVVDQLPFWQFQRLSPYFKHGLKTLHTEGINYENMYFPHARPGTAAGHTGMQTGTYPKDHGMVNNNWLSFDGTKVQAFQVIHRKLQ